MGTWHGKETVSEIRAAVDRIQRLTTEIQGKVRIEMFNVWAKKETNQKLQEVAGSVRLDRRGPAELRYAALTEHNRLS